MGKQAVERRLDDSEAAAMSRMIRVSSRKLNLVARSIRGLDCQHALRELSFCKRRIAQDVKKLLQSAIANAENNHDLDVDSLYVKEATVGRTSVLKRFRARARGRTGRIEKPFSSLRVVVRERQETA